MSLIAILLGLSTLAFAKVVTVWLQRARARPEVPVAFPEIRDWKTLRIKLQRSVCFGTCPDYIVEIDGDGNVSYEGHDFVAVTGTHHGKVPAQAVRALYAQFKKADFYWLFDTYRADITDNPTYAIAISFDGHNKRVIDYVGRTVGMPSEVTDLENQIDAVAGTKQWISGTNETFASLKAEGWNFRSKDAANLRLLMAASQKNNLPLLEQLLSAGVPAGGYYGCRAVAEAAGSRDSAAVRKLIDAGAPVFWSRVEGPTSSPCNALQYAAESGDAASTRLILAERPDVNRRESFGDEKGPTAIEIAVQNSDRNEPGRNYIAVLKLLLGAGAEVRPKGRPTELPILAEAHNPAVIKLLIDAGADVNARSKSFAETPLMHQYRKEAVQQLLEHGADPYALDSDRKNALEKAEKTGFKEAAETLKQWMASHPQPKR